MPTALLQLVSEQTLPNILPALALKPARIILCHTPHTLPQTQWIRRALELAGLNFDLQLKVLSTASDLQETGAAIRASVQRCRADGLDAVVNFTGGTKLMSIGAFAAALNEKTPSFYTDSENLRFVDGGTGTLPIELADNYGALRHAESSLSLEIVSAAHGIENLSAGEDPEPWLPLALHIWHHPHEEIAIHNILGKTNPKRVKDVADFLRSPVVGFSPTVFQLAAEARLLEHRGGAWFFVRPRSLSKLDAWIQGEPYRTDQWFAALAPLQRAISFFCGTWWELVVLHEARRSGIFRDLRWSVTITSGGQTFEKDIVALDGLNLAIFSCKRGGEKSHLVGAIDELDANARQIGGSHSRRFFCVAQPIPKKYFSAVQIRAGQTRSTLIGPANRLTPNSFIHNS